MSEQQGLRKFAIGYMRTQTGVTRMHTHQSIKDAMPAVMSSQIRDEWYTSGDARLEHLAGVATDILGLHKYYQSSKKKG